MILKFKLNGKNKIQATNIRVVSLLRYGAGIINWKIDELNKMDRTRRKTLTMYGTLHPKSDIDRVYLKRKHGGRGLISIKMCLRSDEKKKRLSLKKKENNLGLYERGLSEMLLKGIKKSQYCQN